MVIHISDALIKEAQKNCEISQLLKLIFYNFEKGRHNWYLRNSNINLFGESDFLLSYHEFIEKSIVEHEAYNLSEPEYIIRLCLKSEIESKKKNLTNIDIKEYLDGNRMVLCHKGKMHEFISTKIAESFLGQPLVVLLENIDSDRLFIDKCLLYLSDVPSDNLWLEYDHGGGTDICRVANNIAGKRRVIIIIDRDICTLDSSYRKSNEELEEICEKYGYTLHVLSKREMENYIPDEALKRYLNLRGVEWRNNVYFRLPEELKDYFDLKKGMCSKFDIEKKVCLDGYNCFIWRYVFDNDCEEQAATIESREIDGMINTNGFGRKVWKAFELVESKEELKSRDNNNELESLVNKIFSLI